METLAQLECCLDQLLERYKALEAENSRLRVEFSAIFEEKSVLAEENHKLKSLLARQESLRADVLERIRSLLRKIDDQESLEQVF